MCLGTSVTSARSVQHPFAPDTARSHTLLATAHLQKDKAQEVQQRSRSLRMRLKLDSVHELWTSSDSQNEQVEQLQRRALACSHIRRVQALRELPPPENDEDDEEEEASKPLETSDAVVTEILRCSHLGRVRQLRELSGTRALRPIRAHGAPVSQGCDQRCSLDANSVAGIREQHARSRGA